MGKQYVPQPGVIPQQQPTQATTQEVPVTSDEIYANYLQEERIKNVIAQTSPDNQLVEIQYRIKGYVRNPMTQQWERINTKVPEPSPQLVTDFISYLSGLLNDNTRLSNYSAEEINQVMKLVIEWTVDNLDANADVYGIGENYPERTRIGHIMLHTVFAVLKRALNGQESKRIYDSLMVSETFNTQPQKQAGILEALKFWK